MDTNPPKAAGDDRGKVDRRENDRRKDDLPIESEDRRESDRRSGSDRRKEPRG